LLAARCVPRPGAFVLDLTAPSAGWRETPGSCGATLSPEGDALVWSPDGRVLLEAAVEGGDDAESVLDVAELSNMPPGMDEGVSIIGTLDWGRQGIAIPLGTNERQAAAVMTLDGGVNVTALGNRGAGLGAALAWQPGGSLLASGAWSNLEAAVRLSSGDETRVVAIHPDPIAGLVWSPNGEVLLAASNTRWTFVASDGTWLRSVPVPRGESLPLEWRYP
jgi:WD40 repeat protein